MLTVGQKLWYVPRARYAGSPREVEVEKVGRTWATLKDERLRINKNTLALDSGGYTSPGTIYLDRSQHERIARRNRAWSKISATIRNLSGAPKDVSTAAMIEAAKLLGINIDED